jgi:predicted Holliday junction resolvase-like endonuclease
LSWWAYSSQSDARFIGHPIDFIVFNGLTDGELKEVIFVEVGNENKERELNKHERQVRDIIQQGKVRWECIKINLGEEKNNGKQPQTISTD